MYYKKEALNDKLFPLQNGGSSVSRNYLVIFLGMGLVLFKTICNTVKTMDILVPQMCFCVLLFNTQEPFGLIQLFNVWMALESNVLTSLFLQLAFSNLFWTFVICNFPAQPHH